MRRRCIIILPQCFGISWNRIDPVAGAPAGAAPSSPSVQKRSCQQLGGEEVAGDPDDLDDWRRRDEAEATSPDEEADLDRRMSGDGDQPLPVRLVTPGAAPASLSLCHLGSSVTWGDATCRTEDERTECPEHREQASGLEAPATSSGTVSRRPTAGDERTQDAMTAPRRRCMRPGAEGVPRRYSSSESTSARTGDLASAAAIRRSVRADMRTPARACDLGTSQSAAARARSRLIRAEQHPR